MIVLDPEKRFSAEECLSHSWFKLNNSNSKTQSLSKSIVENMIKFKVINTISNYRMKIN